MNTRSNKMQRLVRLNQFRKEIANGALRHAIHEQNQASGRHDKAVIAMEQLGQWKTQRMMNGGLDLALYSAVLEHEHHAMLNAEKLKVEAKNAKEATHKAQQKMIAAASATKVSEQRKSRLKKQAEIEAEKSQFDQISDVWLNTRERR